MRWDQSAVFIVLMLQTLGIAILACSNYVCWEGWYAKHLKTYFILMQ